MCYCKEDWRAQVRTSPKHITMLFFLFFLSIYSIYIYIYKCSRIFTAAAFISIFFAGGTLLSVSCKEFVTYIPNIRATAVLRMCGFHRPVLFFYLANSLTVDIIQFKLCAYIR